eukprot:SAG31_NODE_5204_length_2678_cov_1.637069_2_plen_83_part_00
MDTALIPENERIFKSLGLFVKVGGQKMCRERENKFKSHCHFNSTNASSHSTLRDSERFGCEHADIICMHIVQTVFGHRAASR